MQPRKDLSGWTGRSNCMKISPRWFDSERPLICFRLPLFSLHFVTRYYTAVFRISLYTWHVFTHAASAATIAALYQCYCCSCRCCSLSCVGWQKLLLVHWIRFHPVPFFSSFDLHLSMICVPVGSTVSFTASKYLYDILGTCAHARSQSRRQLAAAIVYIFCWIHEVPGTEHRPQFPIVFRFAHSSSMQNSGGVLKHTAEHFALFS